MQPTPDIADGPGAALPPTLAYHYGHVMGGTPTVYFIWYGTWSYWGPTDATTILTDFVRDASDSAWFSINAGYSDRFGDVVSGELGIGAMATDPYDHGKYLSGMPAMLGVVQASIDNHVLPLDPNGIYVIAASGDVSDPWVCNGACAWHNHGTIHNTDVKVVFLNDTSRCAQSCPIYTPSPNGNPVADMLAMYLGHELSETVTDPKLSGWYNQSSTSKIENGDRCAWQFGKTFQLPNGAKANVMLRDRYFYMQELWVNSNPGYCTLDPP
jgi:hypothetical protein